MPDRAWRELKLPGNVKESITSNRKKIDLAKEIDSLGRSSISIVTISDSNYPKLLREIYDPPTVLYVRGHLDSNDLKIAVVGTRLMTVYGHQVTENLASELVAAGFTIVSGLARGVDALAHRAALQAGGQTIAVLGSGLNKVYPSENKFLADQIALSGAVSSEYAPESEPSLGTFPSRNRIIAGLSKGVLVTEAGEDSGSLITANLAAEYGRETFTVPGPITSRQSAGANNLAKIGAKVVTSAADITEEFDLSTLKTAEMVPVKGLNKNRR